MDDVTFDRLARAFGAVRSRRRLLGFLASVGLGGVLLELGEEEAAAERPHDRLKRRNKQHHRKQRNARRRKHNNNAHSNNGNTSTNGSETPNACTPNGNACQQNGDCCSQNCFNFVCADTLQFCDNSECQPLAVGCCAVEACCQPPANQCNFGGNCCAPNCAGRQCGPDGCGNGGVCGSCGVGQLCNENGKCVCNALSCPARTSCDETSGKCICTPQSCPNGCCSNGPGNPGTCESGNTNQSCNRGGAQCVACPSGSICGGAGCQVADCAARCNAPAFCLNLIDGTTVCDSGEQESVCVGTDPEESICTSASDCNDSTYTLCVVSYADATTNQTVFNICGDRLGGLCTLSASQP